MPASRSACCLASWTPADILNLVHSGAVSPLFAAHTSLLYLSSYQSNAPIAAPPIRTITMSPQDYCLIEGYEACSLLLEE